MLAGVIDLLLVVYCLTLTLTLSPASPVKDAFTSDEIREVEKFIGEVKACANIPGLALGIVREGATFSTGLGVANMATGYPAERTTIFNLGSTSKAFVPYVLAEVMNGKENRDGRVKWDSTLRDILRHGPDIHIPMPWAGISLKDMLTYRSGSSAADLATMVGLPQNLTREEIMRRLRFLPTSPEFMSSNHHSNVMYTVAAHVAERISGMSWAELVRVKVFDKLAMNSSTFAPEGLTFEDSALPYTFQTSKPGEQFPEQNLTLFNLHPFEPVGSMMVSPEDMTKWLKHLLHNLHFKDNDSGVNMLIADAFHQGVTVPADHKDGVLTSESEVALGYGMGWYASTYGGQRRYKFGGKLYAFSSQVWLFPDVQSAIFVAINGPGTESSHQALDGILYYVSDTILRKPTQVNVEMSCDSVDYDDENLRNHETETAPAEQKLIKYLAPIEKYTGKFGNGFVGNIDIQPNEAGVLILKIGRNLVGELIPTMMESALKFITTSSLVSTEEWRHEKIVKFLPSMSGSGEVFSRVRLYMDEHLFYDFERDILFETMLALAEEEDRRRKEGSSSKNNHNQGEGDIHKDDKDATRGNGHSNDSKGSIDSLDNIQRNDDGGSGESDINKTEPVSNSEAEDTRKGDSNESYQSFNMNGQGDQPDHINMQYSNNDSDKSNISSEKNASTSESRSACPRVASSFTVIFLVVMLNIASKF